MRAKGTPLEATKLLPALLTQRSHRAAGERQRAPSECSECSEISKISTAAPSLRHRSTRTLNPLTPGAAAPSKPNFHIHCTHEHAETQSCFLRNDSFRKKQDYNPKKRFTGCCYDTVLDPASNRVLSC